MEGQGFNAQPPPRYGGGGGGGGGGNPVNQLYVVNVCSFPDSGFPVRVFKTFFVCEVAIPSWLARPQGPLPAGGRGAARGRRARRGRAVARLRDGELCGRGGRGEGGEDV